MKYLHKILILTLTISILSACWGDEEKDYSDDPRFVSLTFAQNDSIPNLETAVFTLEYDANLDDSIIVNVDSLPYKTRIDSVMPTFSFKSTSGAYLVIRDTLDTGYDTILVTGKDTVDFTRVKSITNYAALRTAEPRTYPIKVNVHQVEPELYLWNRSLSEDNKLVGNVQKTVYHNNQFLYFVSSGFTHQVYTSDNTTLWSAPNTPINLPAYINFRDICAFDDKLLIAHEDGKIYESSNGINWSSKDPAVAGYTIENLLFVLENKLWAIFKKDIDNSYYFAESSDGNAWIITEKIPARFPLSDFAAISFASRTNKPKALALGGFSADGELLNSVWSVQKNVDNVYKWVNLTQNNASFKAISGASIITYDDKLLLFGGVDIEGEVIAGGFRESIDEGLNWRQIDTALTVVRDTAQSIVYQARAYQSVVHDADNHFIYLFGGRVQDENGITIFSDIWRGKLNRMWWYDKK